MSRFEAFGQHGPGGHTGSPALAAEGVQAAYGPKSTHNR